MGHFHGLEQSVQMSATDTDGMMVDVAIAAEVPFGGNTSGDASGVIEPVIHMAWIEETGTSQGPIYNGGTTPVYQVYYARSFDGGATFSAAISASGGVSYHPLALVDDRSFGTLDLEVDSAGNPRVVYAMVATGNRGRQKNIYLAYSDDGGASWETPVRANNLSDADGDNCAFPSLAIDDRDNIFIAYVRGATNGGGADDIMLTKVDRSTNPFVMAAIGETGASGSGGVRLAPDGERHTGPDMALGDGDALHLIYFNDTDNRIEHKRLASDTTWVDASASGWDQDADGAAVATFDNAAATNAALEQDALYYFPALAVDRQRLPDRVYAVFKFGANAPIEGIYHNQYDDDGSVGGQRLLGNGDLGLEHRGSGRFCRRHPGV